MREWRTRSWCQVCTPQCSHPARAPFRDQWDFMAGKNIGSFHDCLGVGVATVCFGVLWWISLLPITSQSAVAKDANPVWPNELVPREN